MACAGVDFGNKTSVVAIARRGGIDICCNEVSNRATPTMVSFQGAERHMGEAAASIAAQNHRNTVASIQRLIGIARNNPFAEQEMKRLTFQLVGEPSTNACAARVLYTGVESTIPEDHVFSMQAVCAMLLTNLMATASNEYKAPVRDLVISVPIYYSEAQRRALLDAAVIANINVLRVVNEHTAIALSYGIFRTMELPESTPIKVAFVDVGEASTTVSISAFTNTRCDVLSVACDPSLGGRDLDDIIFNKFAAEFKEKYSIDVMSKPKPAARLRKDCEKVKKVLSTNAEAPLNIECLMNDIDVKGHMKREDLETIAAPLLDRIRAVCERAIADAKLKEGEKLAAVEIVGGSTRVPAFKTVIANSFAAVGAPIRTTLNADECISRGCALMSAMLSPAFRVRDYIVNDINSHSLDAEKVFTDGTQSELVTLVPKGNAIPCLKAMTFKSPGPLSIIIRYSDPKTLPIKQDASHICEYLINAPPDPKAKVRAKVRVTASGIVEMASAQLLQEVEVEEEVVVKEGKDVKAQAANGPVPDVAMTDAPVPNASTPDVSMPDVKPAEQPENNEKPAEKVPPVPAPPVTEKRIVKKMKSSDLTITPLPGNGCGLTHELVSAATEKEAKMRANDLYIKERSEAMNSLEAYIYDIRSRIGDYGDLKDYGSSVLKDSLKRNLDDGEEWIYSEEAEAASKSLFVERKNKLQKMAHPILFRKKEFDERPVRVRVLEGSIDAYKQVVMSNEEKYSHISEEDKKKLMKCVEDASIWLRDILAKQQPLSKDVDPVLTCEALNSKLSEVDKVCRPIQNTPKPKVEEKKEEVKEGESGKPESMEEKNATPKENGNAATVEETDGQMNVDVQEEPAADAKE